MLREMPSQAFFEWMAYSDLEPWSEERADYRSASVVHAIVNMNRDTKKHPEPIELDKFLLKFGEQEPKRKQTWQEQKAIAMMWVALANA